MCVCVFIKLHITAQSVLVILVKEKSECYGSFPCSRLRFEVRDFQRPAFQGKQNVSEIKKEG